MALLCFVSSVLIYASVKFYPSTGNFITAEIENTERPLMPSATISGTTTKCQNSGNTPITFTGSGGKTPYTFTYRINSGSNQTVTTNGNNTSVNVGASTNNVGTFTYSLVRVDDDNGTGASANGNATVTVIQSPNTNMGGTGAGSTFEDRSVFKVCENKISELSFTNTSTTRTTINTNYTIDWGDGSTPFNAASWTTLNHTYEVGIYTLIYTITGNNGCNSVERYTVFVGSNPAVSLGSPGNTDICSANTLTFPITGTDDNPPGTFYTVTFNDGSAPVVFSHPPPTSITHLFDKSSCNITSSDGSVSYANSFSANIVAANPCSRSSVGVVPIFVSIMPMAEIDMPETACTNQSVTLENTSVGEEINGSNLACDESPSIIWSITPASGYTVTSGDIGDDFGLTDPKLWATGSDILTVNFTQVGTYDVSIKTGNRCGEDVIVKKICIESPLSPQFNLDAFDGCGPLSINTTNTTDISDSCNTPAYAWTVKYTSDFCGTTPEIWSFTNGTNASSENPSFSFETAGTYDIVLTTTNSCGDESATRTIKVKQPPIANITPITNFCGTASLTPTANINSCAPAGETITYNWDFPGGTPATSSLENPGTIEYTSIGDYVISLEVTNSCGMVTTTENFSVNPSPVLTNTDLTQTICSGTSTAQITLTSDLTATTYIWNSNNPPGVAGYLPSGSANTIPAQILTNSNTTTSTLIYTVVPSFQGCDGDPINFAIDVIPAPIITNQPQSSDVCENGTATILSVAFTGTGTPNYQWFSNSIDDNTSGSAISGATNDTFDPPTDVVGTVFYYCVITFASGGCDKVTSDTAEVTVAPGIQIDTHPLNTQSICVGGTSALLEVSISGGAGNLSYQWFSNTTSSNSGGTLISGATSNSYQPPIFNTAGTFYFYAEISSTANGCQPQTSDVAEINVVPDPVIDVQPLTLQELCQNSIAQNLEVQISGGIGTTTYQWHENTIDDVTSGMPIPMETNAVFTPPTTVVGTTYYYCVITQDISGCESTSDTGTVIITTAPNFTSQPISNVLCLGSTTPNLTVTYTNGTGTPGYQWYQNTVDDVSSGTAIAGETSAGYSPDVSMVNTNYYYCIITFSTGGCNQIVSSAAEIIVNETPIISDANRLICSNNSFDYTPDNSSGDAVPMNTTYMWSAPNVSPAGSISGATEQTTPITTISQLLINNTTNPAVATYIVTPTSDTCIGHTFEVVVTVNPSISVAETVTNDTCFQSGGGSIDLTISGGVPFATAPDYQITWTGPNGFSSTSKDISALEPGTYSLNIVDDGGCPFSAAYTLVEPDELVFGAIDFDPQGISCFGANDGKISIAVAGGTLPYQYTWTKDGANFSTDEDLIDLGPGLYEITATDANNCGPIVSAFMLDQPDALIINPISSTDILCFGDDTGAIAVDVLGGRTPYVYNWSGPNGFVNSSKDLSNLFAGTYNLEVTDNSGCTENYTMELIQNTEIKIDVTTIQISCFDANDASITINSISGGVAGYTIAWSNFGTGMSQTNLAAGTYTVMITDAIGCIKEFPIIIDSPPDFFVNPLVTQLSCFGESDASIVLNFVGGQDPVNVNWSDDPTAGLDRNNLEPGTYTVKITDGMPCVIEETFTIFDIDELIISANITDALECNDVNTGAINTLIQGGTLPYSVVWSNGATTEDLDAIPPGTYVITITDANGCELEATYEVIRFEPLVLDVETDSIVDCNARTVDQTFTAMANGGVPPFQFSWSSGNVSGINNEIMTTEQNGLVILDVVDSFGCTETFSFNVEIPVLGFAGFESGSIGFDTFGVYSILDPIQFTNQATGDFTQISWNFGDGNFSTEENPIHIYTAEGTYIVTQTVTYPFGCVYTERVSLIVEKGYRLIMPNAFTPNEDTLNDFFGPEHVGLDKMTFEIYDTWGSLIYSETGDDVQGWDGKIKDYDAENGNYYFTFSAETFYGNRIKEQGAFVYIK